MLLHHLLHDLRLTEVCVKRMLSPWLYIDVIYRFSSLYKCQQKYVSTLYKFVENLLHHNDNIKNLATLTSPKTITNHYKNHNIWNVNVDGDDRTDDSNELNKKSKSYVFVEQIRNHIDEGQLTWQDVRDEANVIVAATFETTSTALYLVCLCLAMHPECQDKLYKELIEIFPSPAKCSNYADNSRLTTELSYDGNGSIIFTDVTLEQLEQMKYTEMVINEAMRLFAPVPMVLRSASNEFQLRNGITIPKGTQIGIDIYNMQRRKDIWGPLAHTFNPDKHFGPYTKPHPFAFVPFTKGLRMCIGYRYAIILMKVMLAKIFLNFRLTTCTNVNMENIKIKGTISLKLVEYPLCQLQQRNSLNPNTNNKY
ncbi:hypothetical protein DOY81_004095 [Sarcophaga bullata]|nr:hypothetical protein DOY81_004095 [Sarcophaga bullata]